MSSKHALARANPDEAKKLSRIERDLCSRTELIEVNTGVDDFEKETNYFFNEQMDKEGLRSFRPVLDPLSMTSADRFAKLKADQDAVFAKMLSTDSFRNFQFSSRGRQ